MKLDQDFLPAFAVTNGYTGQHDDDTSMNSTSSLVSTMCIAVGIEARKTTVKTHSGVCMLGDVGHGNAFILSFVLCYGYYTLCTWSLSTRSHITSLSMKQAGLQKPCPCNTASKEAAGAAETLCLCGAPRMPLSENVGKQASSRVTHTHLRLCGA